MTECFAGVLIPPCIDREIEHECQRGGCRSRLFENPPSFRLPPAPECDKPARPRKRCGLIIRARLVRYFHGEDSPVQGVMQYRLRSVAIAAVLVLSSGANAQPSQLSDAQVREQLVQESIAAYQATGHPCACPDDLARNGFCCGGRSAYSRPGGATPLCYPNDVSDEIVRQWRRTHNR